MLGKPEAGWSEFQLGSEETRYDLSYLTDVAYEWLIQAIHGLETMEPFSVHGVCEPGRVICTISYWSCYVIFEDEDREPECYSVHHLHVTMIEFCRMLYEDISNYLEDWVHWDDTSIFFMLDDEGDEQVAETVFNERRTVIQEKLGELKILIDKRSEHYDNHRCFF